MNIIRECLTGNPQTQFRSIAQWTGGLCWENPLTVHFAGSESGLTFAWTGVCYERKRAVTERSRREEAPVDEGVP